MKRLETFRKPRPKCPLASQLLYQLYLFWLWSTCNWFDSNLNHIHRDGPLTGWKAGSLCLDHNLNSVMEVSSSVICSGALMELTPASYCHFKFAWLLEALGTGHQQVSGTANVFSHLFQVWNENTCQTFPWKQDYLLVSVQGYDAWLPLGISGKEASGRKEREKLFSHLLTRISLRVGWERRGSPLDTPLCVPNLSATEPKHYLG